MGKRTDVKCTAHYICEIGEGKTYLDAHFSYLKTHITNEVKRGQGMSDMQYLC